MYSFCSFQVKELREQLHKRRMKTSQASERCAIIFLVYNTQVNSAFCTFYLLTQRRLAKYFSPLNSRRETKWLPVSLRLWKLMFWSTSYLACVVYIKRTIHLSVGESGGYLPPPPTSE